MRIKYVWSICHQYLFDKFIQDLEEGRRGKERESFVMRLVQEKVVYFHRMKLLSSRIILQRNKYAFGLVFDMNMCGSEGVDYERLLIAFILSRSYELQMGVLPVDKGVFVEFIEEYIYAVGNEVESNKSRGMSNSKQLIQALVIIT